MINFVFTFFLPFIPVSFSRLCLEGMGQHNAPHLTLPRQRRGRRLIPEASAGHLRKYRNNATTQRCVDESAHSASAHRCVEQVSCVVIFGSADQSCLIAGAARDTSCILFLPFNRIQNIDLLEAPLNLRIDSFP